MANIPFQVKVPKVEVLVIQQTTKSLCFYLCVLLDFITDALLFKHQFALTEQEYIDTY